MNHKFSLLLLIFLFFCASAGFAADGEFEKGDFWFCPSAEAALYNYSGFAYGGGFALGYGRGTSIGLKIAFFPSQEAGDTKFIDDYSEGINVIEINCLIRFYFSGNKAYSGSFIQFMGGPAIIMDEGRWLLIPSKIGAFSFGLGLGWRFLILDRVFIEPYFRGGYPYIIGAGISVGARF